MDEYRNVAINIVESHFAKTDSSDEGYLKLAQLIADITNSFGGCVKCWGAGYTSDPLGLCDCTRGVKLGSLMPFRA